jgi:hypothetical protein
MLGRCCGHLYQRSVARAFDYDNDNDNDSDNKNELTYSRYF